MPTDDLIRDAVAKARKTLCEGDTMTPCCLEDYDAEVIMEVAVREYIDLAAEQLEPGADLEGRAREWMGRECPSYMKDAPELRQAIIKSLAALLRDVAGEERERFLECLKEIDNWWSFDDCQCHTHTWHDKQEIMQRVFAKVTP